MSTNGKIGLVSDFAFGFHGWRLRRVVVPVTLAEALFSLFLKSEPWYEDRNEVGRESRMLMFTVSVIHAAHHTPGWKRPKLELVALLYTEAIWESRLNRRVHAGECRKDECDPSHRNGKAYHSSVSVWQLKQNNMSREAWQAMVGITTEATTLAADEAARRLAHGLRYCSEGTIEGAMNAYATGTCREHPLTKQRAETYKRALSFLKREMTHER